MTLKLAEGVYWVGAIDWNVRDFHGYSTPLGTTYNAYLVVDDKIALIDFVPDEDAIKRCVDFGRAMASRA